MYNVQIIVNGELVYLERLDAERVQELIDKANEIKED